MNNFSQSLRANNLFAGIISQAIAQIKRRDNAGDSTPIEIQTQVETFVQQAIANEPGSQVFYAAQKLIPTLTVNVGGATSILDAMIIAMARMITNDTLAFCGIEVAPLPEFGTDNSVYAPRTERQKPTTAGAHDGDISDAMRDELSGANVVAGAGDNDCGDACKI